MFKLLKMSVNDLLLVESAGAAAAAAAVLLMALPPNENDANGLGLAGGSAGFSATGATGVVVSLGA